MSDDKALDKIDIASELKTLSPLEKKSLELKARAVQVNITDKETYGDAKKLKRELVSHRTSVKDLRLTFTRKLDNLKDQFIKKQDEVLQPSIEGESLVKQQVELWEQAERERKEAESKRVQEILDKFKAMQPVDFKTGTPEDVKRLRAAIKMELSLLDPKDRTKVAVKTLIEDLRTELDAVEGLIFARLEQEDIAKAQAIEQKRLDDERAELEAARGAVTPAVRENWAESEKKYSVGVPESSESVETLPLQETINNHIRNVNAQTDKLVMEMLNTYGFKIDPLNLEGSRKELQNAGYELIHESQGGIGMEQVHRYKLMRLVEQVEIKVKTEISTEE